MARSALLLLALLALCAARAAALGSGTEAAEEPPRYFPSEKARPFNGDKLRPTNVPNEAADMIKNVTVAVNETVTVNHPMVKDPGTTHEEDQADSRGTIQACELPDPGSASSASDWLADSKHISKLADLCKLPSSLLNSTSGTLRVCSIPKDVWDSAGNNFTSGTVPKELLDKLNALNVTCVTPRSNSSVAGNGTVTSGSIPSASLWGKNNTIYIYIVPREWLRRGKPSPGKASEVDDLTSERVHEESPTEAPTVGASPTKSPVNGSSVAAAAGDTTVEFTTPLPASSTKASNASAQAPPTNATAPASMNTTGSAAASTTIPTASPGADANGTLGVHNTQPASASTPPTESKDLSNKTQTAIIAPTKKPIDSVKTTDRPREETTKPQDKKSTETKKPFDKSVDITSTVEPVTLKQKPTDAPVSLSTKKPKEESVKPREHSDAENEVVHKDHSAPSPAPLSQSHERDHVESSGKTGFLQPTESAAILAGVFVAIAVLGYAGLLLWRRVLEKRYGNREMLVNEDDDFDTSDMRHFEL